MAFLLSWWQGSRSTVTEYKGGIHYGDEQRVAREGKGGKIS